MTERLFVAFYNQVRTCYPTDSSLLWQLAVVKFCSFRKSGHKIFYFSWHRALEKVDKILSIRAYQSTRLAMPLLPGSRMELVLQN
jgi:hypothetical protein